MINGKNLPKKRTKILNHLDRICFAGSIMYVFYYPLLNILTREIVEKNADENADLDMKIRKDQAWADIQDNGMPDFSTSACPNYAHVEEDRVAIDWDMAFAEVEDCVKAKDAKEKKEKENQ